LSYNSPVKCKHDNSQKPNNTTRNFVTVDTSNDEKCKAGGKDKEEPDEEKD
jgi:hypothetical protein